MIIPTKHHNNHQFVDRTLNQFQCLDSNLCEPVPPEHRKQARYIQLYMYCIDSPLLWMMVEDLEDLDNGLFSCSCCTSSTISNPRKTWREEKIVSTSSRRPCLQNPRSSIKIWRRADLQGVNSCSWAQRSQGKCSMFLFTF